MREQKCTDYKKIMEDFIDTMKKVASGDQVSPETIKKEVKDVLEYIDMLEQELRKRIRGEKVSRWDKLEKTTIEFKPAENPEEAQAVVDKLNKK